MLMASGAPGVKFLGWLGTGSNCHGPTMWCIFYIDKDMTVTAYFGTSSYFDLVVTKSGTGTGTVSSNVPGVNCGADCEEKYFLGSAVTLTPVPDPGSLFAGWSGACTGTASCTVTIDDNKAVTAIFVLPLALNSPVSPNGEVGLSYNVPLIAAGGLPPYTFNVVKGALRPGLSLGSLEIVGTPTRAGTYKFTV